MSNDDCFSTFDACRVCDKQKRKAKGCGHSAERGRLAYLVDSEKQFIALIFSSVLSFV